MKKPLSLLAVLMVSSSALVVISCHPTGVPDTQLGNWVQAAPIGDLPRGYASCFVIGKNAYVGLGYNQTIGQPGRLTDFWKFTVDSGWTQIAPFPGAPRSNASSFSIGAFGYIGVGWDSYNVFSDFYQYDTLQNLWTPKASFKGAPRYDAVGFGVQGKGYIGTGFNKVWMNDFWQYDPVLDTWALTQGTSGNFSKRQGAVALVYNDRAYIVGGMNNGVGVRDFWRFDPSQPAAWYQLANITNTDAETFDDGYSDIERTNATAFINGDQAFLTTGSNGGVLQSSTWAYDFATDRWGRRTAYPKQLRAGAVSFTVSGRSFVGAGSDVSSNTYDDFDEFLPNVAFNSNDY